MLKKTKIAFTSAFIILLSIFLLAACSNSDSVMASITDAENGLSVPIIMYHSVVDDSSKTGEYVITPKMLKEDILYLKNMGYETVLVSDLIDYVSSGKPLPKKVVVLTFDDGCYNFLTEVMPILSDTNSKATLSVVGSFAKKEEPGNAQSPYYSYLTLEQIKQISECGYVEIASHSYNMHSINSRRGSLKMNDESYEDYRSRFLSDTLTNKMLLEEIGVVTDVYTYPYGLVCEESLELVKACRFKASLGVEEKTNYLTSDKSCLYCMGRYNRPADETTEEFMERVLSE